MIHPLKTWPSIYRATEAGVKRFEFRKNDRNFRVGDTLALQEYDPDRDDYTGEQMFFAVTYLLTGPDYGIPEGYCVMSIEPVAE